MRVQLADRVGGVMEACARRGEGKVRRGAGRHEEF